MSRSLVIVLSSCLGVLVPQIGIAGEFPGTEWATSAPERQGMSGNALDAAAAYALKYGGGSGCVVRHGVLVKEWGDPNNLADIKSATKGSFGATALGLAVDRGLVKLDDLAQKRRLQGGKQHHMPPRECEKRCAQSPCSS